MTFIIVVLVIGFTVGFGRAALNDWQRSRRNAKRKAYLLSTARESQMHYDFVTCPKCRRVQRAMYSSKTCSWCHTALHPLARLS